MLTENFCIEKPSGSSLNCPIATTQLSGMNYINY